VEDLTGSLALLVMAVLPIAEIVSRRFFGRGIPASGPVVQHLTLWVGFLGAAIAAREGKLLALATGTFIPQGLWRRAADIVAAAFGACSAIVLAWGGWQMAAIEREAGTNILAGILFIRAPSLIEGAPLPLGFAIIVVAAVAGTPLFAILGGTAAFLFMREGTTPATILIETYSLSVSPTLPAIPLFTLAGFLLAEGRASERLLRVFRAWFGWIPGGTAVVCAVLCSFFTVFTGGSGVTILALGGVLFPA